MKYEKVYDKARQNMADESDYPDNDDLIAAALEVAKDAVKRSFWFDRLNKAWQDDILASIDALSGKHTKFCPAYCPWPDTDWVAPGAHLPKCRGGDCTMCDELPCDCYVSEES